MVKVDEYFFKFKELEVKFHINFLKLIPEKCYQI